MSGDGSDHDDLNTLCQQLHGSLGAAMTMFQQGEHLKAIGLSVIEHLHAQLMEHFPDISVQEHRVLAASILEGVYHVLRQRALL